MTRAQYPVVVIGGGQAGLAISYCLKARGIEHLVLEKHCVAHAWRSERWDSFCLVTPNWQCRLPGFPYAGADPKGFMLKDEIVRYLEAYVAAFGPPLLEETCVLRVSAASGGHGFVLQTTRGEYHADQVVVATGGYHEPKTPKMAHDLPVEVVQLHSSSYRNPQQLPAGEVMVVGSGQSGCQIAEDLHLAGRRVHLCLGSAPRVSRFYRGKDVVEWLERMGHYDMPIDQHPDREGVRKKSNHYVTGRDGGRDIDLRKFAREGMQLHGRLTHVSGTSLQFGDDLERNLDRADATSERIKDNIDAFVEREGIDAPIEARTPPVWRPTRVERSLSFADAQLSSVIWCLGFALDFRWIELPAFNDDGYPRHARGVTEVPGLYFLGLSWLYTWGSGRFSGIARDAAFVCDAIAARSRTRTQEDSRPIA